MANAGLKDEGTNLPRIHNALCFPDLTVFGPEITSELYPLCGSLGWKISIQADADRVPVFNYCIVEENPQNDNAVNTLKCGDWITLINGTSTTDKDEAFFEKVKTACCDREDGLSVVIKTPADQQDFHLWDQKPVKIDIKTRGRILPFTLEIFYPDLNDASKTFTLVHKIQQLLKLDLKGLKRGDKVIAINDHQLLNKTYKEVEQITSQLNKQQQLKLTVERRQWRQNGYLTKSAIDRPTHLIWRPLQAELKKKKLTKKLGFKIKCVENPLERPCIIITHIFAGEKPAAMSPYLNPGCKIMAINGRGLNGLPFEKVKDMLQRAPASVMLTIQEPTCLLHGKRFLPSGGRYTWPVEVEKAPLYKSISEGQFPLENGHYICSMCSHKAAGQNITADAQPTPLSVLPQPVAESGNIQNGQEFKDISPVVATPASPQPRGSDETRSATWDGPSSSARYGGTQEMGSIQHGQGFKDTTAFQTHCSSPRPKGNAVQPTGYSETRSATWDGPSSSTRYGGTQEMGSIQHGQGLQDTTAVQTTSVFASPELAGCNDQPPGYNEMRSATWNDPSSRTRHGGTQEIGTFQNGQELTDSSATQTTSLFTSPELAGCNDQPTEYDETRSAMCNGATSTTRYGSQGMGIIQNGQEFRDAEKRLGSLSLHGGLPNSPLPLPSDHGIANGATIHCRLSGIQESGTSLSLPSEPCETPKDQEIPVCQNCLTITVTDKREHSIEQVPGTIYYLICMRLDNKSHFLRDYRIMGEKLGFSRRAISLLENHAQPTDCLLNEWIARKGKEATVSVLMEILSGMERQELLELLQSWTDTCPKCFENQQKNVRESYI